MISLPRFPWRHALLAFCTTALLCAQPTRSKSSPPRKSPAAAVAESKSESLAPELPLVAQFDRDGDQRLDATERAAARAYLVQQPAPVPSPSSPGNRRPTTEESTILEPIGPGEKIAPAQAATFAGQPLYEPGILRTLFLEFPDADWEAQLTEFARTDVLVHANLTIDGRSYAGVGVRFQALPAGTTLPAGYKRTLSLALDFIHADQELGGERRLRLDDARDDPTLVRGLLYRKIARAYLPTPQANTVRVVINGEFWGLYVSQQPLDETFTRESYGTTAGTRWIAVDRADLAYLGDDPAPYRARYRLLSPENPAAWAKLILLCKTLDQTPLDQIAAALAPLLDVDRTLRFLALETALMNPGGYTGNGRGYGLFLDPAGRFHFVPLATESSFRLLAEHEFESTPSRGRSEPRPVHADAAVKKTPPETASPLPSPNGTPGDFPKQSATDLAMLLSYSFVNKVDRNEDLKLGKTEWLDFARAWFIVIDEDYAGAVTRDQLTTSVRNLVTPASMRNPHAKQTFAGDDAAAVIARDLWAAMNRDGDERVTREEFTGTFAEWFDAWTDPKAPQLTQPILQSRFESLFSRTVFQADQLYIPKRGGTVADKPGVPGERGGRGGGSPGQDGGFSAGGSLSVLGGAIGLGPGGRSSSGGRNRSSGGRTVVTYYSQLAPLGPLDDPANVLYVKLLAAPSLRARYLGYVREIADTWLNWQTLGPVAKSAQTLIADDVKRESHSAHGYIRFVQDFDQDTGNGNGRTRDSTVAPNLKTFIEERRVYLQKNTPEND